MPNSVDIPGTCSNSNILILNFEHCSVMKAIKFKIFLATVHMLHRYRVRTCVSSKIQWEFKPAKKHKSFRFFKAKK